MEPFATRLAAPRRALWPDRPIPLAFVITDLDVGGAERALVQLATRIDRSAWSPTVIALTGEGALAGDLRAADIPTVCLNVRRLRPLQALRRLRSALAPSRPHLIQSFLFHANIAARLAVPRRGAAPWLVGGLRVAERQRGWHLWLDRATQHLACGSVCVSEGVRRFSVEEAGLDPRRLVVISNGVDLARIDQAEAIPRESLGLDRSSLVVLFVGRLDPQKGLGTLLDAWGHLLSQREDAILFLAGEGPERAAVERWIGDDRRRASRVRLLGHRSDIPSLLKIANLLVLPSLWEGMPNAVLEAMAAGVPVVATRVEGTEELVIDGETGWLVTSGDFRSLGDALVNAVGNPDEARRRGLRGRHRAESQFALAHSVRGYQQLWAAILGLSGDRFDREPSGNPA